MTAWTLRLVIFCVCVFFSQYGAVTAFQATKSRETPAGTARAPFQMNKPQPHADVHPTVSAPATATHFAFAPAVQGGAYYEEEDDEMEISVGTAIVACAISLALGFGLGYGT